MARLPSFYFQYRSRPIGNRITAAIILVLIALMPIHGRASAAPQPEKKNLTELVNPFIGTQHAGNTFPGAAAPFGMVQVSPDTLGTGGFYSYDADKIYGFSQAHLSGAGCGVLGELPFMPTTGPINSVIPSKYASRFSHNQEQAHPGAYSVRLEKYGIKAELTATARTGWQRYTFPATAHANVLFNTGKANMPVFNSAIHIIGKRSVAGRIRDGHFCAGHDQHTTYFVAKFSRPFTAHGTWRGSKTTPGSRNSANQGPNGGWVSFNTTKDEKPIVVKVGLSYTSIAGARKNLQAETARAGFDFDAVRRNLQGKWEKMLHKIEITGGSHDRQVAFYTALYHAMLHPNRIGDVDGKYIGFDDKVHQATDYTPYANFSLWDAYRPQNQLLEMLVPKVARNIDLSILAVARQGGWLPRWELVNSETNIMTGDPVTPFLAEGWSKGLLVGHAQEAYRDLRAYARQPAPAKSPFNGRAGVKYYDRDGYIPYGLKLGTDCPDKGGDNDCSHPASATLEYSAADAALALVAKGLDHPNDARMFAQRGQWYHKLFDPRMGFFRPRTKNGAWLSPYDPARGAHAFHESGAYQYQWLVPQDPAGLVQMLGGRRHTNERLDQFFAYKALLAHPAKTARTQWVRGAYEYYGKKTYNPNNEPDLIAPYTYAWTGAPNKIATVIRAALTLFTNKPDGMTGNDDMGTMSAWYVFSSLGLYPTMSGANFFVLTSPQFATADVHLGDYRDLQHGTLKIRAPDTSWQHRYINSAKLNGKTWSYPWMGWKSISHGGAITYKLSDEPGKWGTNPQDAPPSVDQYAKLYSHSQSKR